MMSHSCVFETISIAQLRVCAEVVSTGALGPSGSALTVIRIAQLRLPNTPLTPTLRIVLKTMFGARFAAAGAKAPGPARVGVFRQLRGFTRSSESPQPVARFSGLTRVGAASPLGWSAHICQREFEIKPNLEGQVGIIVASAAGDGRWFLQRGVAPT